ncbi:hypothetical protein [Psychromarinibacter sp. S121]|uniref:hypothetical protein n=1 Tax=Psychromarinibacter sp. S121 TaxID=3415127 RepID=UPI003C7DD9C6
MFRSRLIEILKSFLVSIAIYPVVLVGVWGLIALGSFASDMHMPTDTMPLVYGLVFAVLTVALIDILGVASVVLALVSSANLIEYAQMLVPGREPSAVDFIAGLGGVILAATLVCAARSLVERQSGGNAAA